MAQTKEKGSLEEAVEKEEGRGSSFPGFIFLLGSHIVPT